jgi:hypothetical protein
MQSLTKFRAHLVCNIQKLPCFERLNYLIYRVSIKSFPDYKHLLQENYVEYENFFNVTQLKKFFLQLT